MATIKSGSHKNAGQKSKNLSSGAVKKRKTGGIVKLKQIYRGKEMSLSGTFISCGKPASHEKIAAWITAHGGTFALEVTSSTTHLICSIEDFKKGTEQVKKALALGKENCHIVVFDWLEECLVRKNKLCRSERYWTLESTLKRLSKKGAEIDTLKKRFQNGVQACEEFTGQSTDIPFF
ncbi:putative RNA polymerase II subunit A C-terminal domain phosphatase [Glarea lozoyensis 74030]|uniref:Putative RNA polymerase II subunit A C-terminal domain phosphatase n=1 Tax=Glarea lozoyensis (strain ATCC 74030 / MF5533) TaxID=1104152 RepID=H0ES55_GLAL7|nr:putative RNA polymerase II subunit A C-terminal domain phosphatase [Glarea lozoyensis 74030]